MDGHFRAFSFVDRITRLEPGRRIGGTYAIPPVVKEFSSSLVAEAVGQLAAWAAMAAVDWSHRPVAGIAGTIQLQGNVGPGQVLELAAELESVDVDTVGYSGSAHVGGVSVIRLVDCVGPMVPLEDFDEPQSVRERFNLLRADGASPGGFAGVDTLDVERCGGEPGQSTHSKFRVPTDAPFFADHFPRRPVLPGTLLMQAHLKAAGALAAEVSLGSGSWVPRIVSDVKLRTYIAPGAVIDLMAARTGLTESTLVVSVESRIGPRLVSSAEVLFQREART